LSISQLNMAALMQVLHTGRLEAQLSLSPANLGVQDTSVESQSKSSQGFSVSIPVYGAGGSFSLSLQNQEAQGNYSSVNEQSGIFAGFGGFNLNVGGNTGLVGAVIASEAAPSKNSLVTASLTTSDIANQADYSAQTSGFGVSLGDGMFNLAPSLPMNDNGGSASLTRSAVAAGTVTITDEAAQLARTGQTAAETVASLNRDTQNAHQGPLDHNPDLDEILAKQGEIFDAADKAGKAVTKTIEDITLYFDKFAEEQKKGKWADNVAGDPSVGHKPNRWAHEDKKDEAEKVLVKAKGVIKDEQANAVHEKWKDGSLKKIGLSVAGAALVAQIGNGTSLFPALKAADGQMALGQLRASAEKAELPTFIDKFLVWVNFLPPENLRSPKNDGQTQKPSQP